MNQFFGGNGVIVRTENDGADFGDSTFITFPPIGSSGVAHPHETIQFGDELFVPDLVSPCAIPNLFKSHNGFCL